MAIGIEDIPSHDQRLERFFRFGWVRIDDLVPNEVLLLFGRQMLDIFINQHELGQRRHVEAGARLVERSHDGWFGVCLDRIIRLHLWKMPFELGVVLANLVVVNDDQRRGVATREGLKLFARHSNGLPPSTIATLL